MTLFFSDKPPEPDECCLKNNMISMRDGEDWLFRSDGPYIYAKLDGYAIIPREEYVRLKQVAGEEGDLSL